MTPADPYESREHERGDVYLVADDDEFFRVAMSNILRQRLGGAKIIETGSLDEALEQLSGTDRVVLALFDLAMPGMESAASLRAVRQCFPDTQVAVVSASTRRSDVLLALEAGVHGYIPKGLGIVELARALQLIRAGSIYVPTLLADLIGTEDEPARVVAASKSSESVFSTGLTRRQRDVLQLVVQGLSNKDIARALNLGEGTVKVHVAALFRTLGVTSRSAAAAAGVRLLQSSQDNKQR